MFLQTGIRVSELIALLLVEFNRQHKTLTVHRKGSCERVISLEKKALQALNLYLDHID